MPYKVALTHDQALEDLDNIVPQPATIGYQFARRSYAASGAVIDENPFVEFNWTTIGTAAQYAALLTQFGLSSALTSEVTVYVQNENYAWVLRNGVAVKPFIGSDGQRNRSFLRGFTILVKALEVTA